MSKSKFEYRFAVGQPDGLRSSVWKLWGVGNDIYIQPRMMGSDSKVSLHESGSFQWSATSEWIKKQQSDVKNSDRHFVKWQLPNFETGKALLVFRIVIPRSELRIINTPEKLSKVNWIALPSEGNAVIVECYYTPPVEGPLNHQKFPYEHLLSYNLPDGRWFVVLYHEEVITKENKKLVENSRTEIISIAKKEGIEILPSYRAAVFFENEMGYKGLIEMALV